jgi:hypothetical protein
MSYTDQKRPVFVRWGALAAVTLVSLIYLAGMPGRSAAGDPTGYNPNDLPVASCFWTGPFTQSNPRTNIAYPGTEITYWGAKFITPPGAVLTLKGRYPYARYSSLNAYTEDGVSTGSLSDRQIRPDSGSTNPSIPGRNRRASKRSYTVTVRGEAEPSSPARNTLYAEPVDGNYQDILYRVYIPDRGRNRSGGTGLPTPSLRLGDGTVLTGQALCDEMNSIHNYTNDLLPEGVYENLLRGKGLAPDLIATNPAEPTLRFGKYFNLPTSLARYGVPEQLEAAWAANPTYVGTQYDNSDARYMTAAYSFRFGQVVVIKGRLPTTPRTLNRNRKMTRGQLVAWDMCIIQSLVTTKTWRCVFDEQLPLRGRSKREYTIVISSPANRPKNATTRCGVWWMAADPEGDGFGRTDVGQLLTRNVLPAPDFRRSSWAVETPFAEDAAGTMGPFYPRGSHSSKAAFERQGCSKVKKPKKKKPKKKK